MPAQPKPIRRRRFPILISPLWRALLVPFGATAEQSFVEVEDGKLHVRFGWLFDHRFPLEQVERATPGHWPLWAGVGPRTDFRGVVGLVGTYVNTVEVLFKKRQRVRMVLPVSCQRLYLSLEDPRGFIGAVGKHPEAAESEAKAA